VLVNPPYKWDREDKEVLYPFSLLYLISYLYKKSGLRCSLIDCDGLNLNQEEFRERLDIANPDVIGFTGNTRARFLVYDEIRYARQVFPKVKIVVGGAHFTPTAEEALRILPQIDVVVRGEGEITFYELIESWHNGSPLEKIDGISYRQDGRIVHNPDRKPFLRIMNLTSMKKR